MKLTVPLGALAAILLLSLSTLCGQSALDGFDPNANGAVRAVAVQRDGKILIGGDFTTLTPNAGATIFRNHMARLNVDGTLDMSFDPRPNATVRSIVVQSDGKILIGGDFTVLSALPRILRNHIARLDATTGLPDSFDPNADNVVRSIALQSDGKVLAGGDFTTLSPSGGAAVTRNRITRVNSDGTLDTAFNPSANASVRAIALQAGILAGGDFTKIGGATRNNIARLNPTTGLAESFNPNANGQVDAISVQADGKILTGGTFTSIAGQTRNRIARLNGVTGAAELFNPNADGEVDAIAVQADGKILAGGTFVNIGGHPRHNLARLDATTGAADAFQTPNGEVDAIAVQADGKVLAGGTFTSINGRTRNFIARLEADGRLDQTLNLSTVGGSVDAIAVQTDGKILIGGSFSTVLGVTRHNIAQLNTDGTLDTTFIASANDFIIAIAVQADGQILAGGAFTSMGGDQRNHIARLNAVTGLPDSFNPNANGLTNVEVEAIGVQTDGKILVGGNFENIGGATRHNIARLDASTGLADLFNPNVNGFNSGDIASIAVQTDGKILVGGSFTSIGGQARNNIARLNADGTLEAAFHPEATGASSPRVQAIAVQADGKILTGGTFTNIGGATRHNIARLIPTNGIADNSFDPNVSGFVLSIAVQADGKILVGGFFTNIGGQSRNNIARLDTTGLADSFNPNANSEVEGIAVQADGKILAGGFFTNIGGQSRNLFARLTNDTGALQNVDVTQTSITWTRGGSSPQFARVTFEISFDNVNFNLLGDGTAAGSNWILTGLSLPAGRNFIIRARGFYRSGQNNGSESITGSRRNTFFPGSFVIGDGNAVIGQRVVFWGAQWAKWNSLSDGPAPASFKGFASSTSTNPPECGGTWQSDAGNSSAPPDGLPDSLDVIVASSITKSGGVILGNIPEMAVVQADPGYDSNPGHAGTGTVVSVSCGR